MGKHLICDFESFDEKLNDKKHIQNYLNSLVKTIKMNKLTEPIVKEGTKHLPGVSGFVMIETSHISIHTFTKQNRLNIDVYSCKNFNEVDVFDLTNNFFNGLELMSKNILRRDDGQ